jgi:hypothetical protein
MADYGIFGHGSSGNSWFSRKLNDFHDSTKKYDPIGHYSVENPMKSAHWLVEKTSGGLADAGIGTGFNTRLNQEADENGNNFGLGSQRMGVGIGSVLAAMYGGSYFGDGGSSAGGLGAGDGAFLGEGVSSGIPAWDGAAGGMGLGFDPNGLGEGGAKGLSDFPTMNGQNSWMSQLTGQGGQGGLLGGGQQPQKLEEKNLGNPLLMEALLRLVQEQEAQYGRAA